MWILTPVEPGGETPYLLPGKEYIVGRKNCDILLSSDQSISRSHAQLAATDQMLTLKDTSKYGTFVNNQRITAPVNLTVGDNVTFGVFQSKFTVIFIEKPLVCSSCLDNPGKTSLSQALSALGGKLVSTWSPECTHLVMPTVKVTIKTISALMCCRPIVKPEFFSELNNAVRQKSPLPKAESFLPEIDEPSLSTEKVNLGIIERRRQLFTGKTFFFLTAKQLKRLNTAVGLGGGRSQLLEKGSFPRNLLESPLSCVVDVAIGGSQNSLPTSLLEFASSVKNILQGKGLRLITESEIGLAAIYASCDKYCNPTCSLVDSDPAQKVNPRIPSASLSQNVAVDETVLPAASQNITAYAVNTEASQRWKACDISGVEAVGETPEKKQSHTPAQYHGSRCSAGGSVVADSMISSPNSAAAEHKDSKRKEHINKGSVSGRSSSENGHPAPTLKTSNIRAAFHKQSPQKTKAPAQTSPQKQSTLTNFFQSISKKRPLEDELTSVASKSKRSAPESIYPQDANTPKEKPSSALNGPPAVSETPFKSPSDLFTRKSEVLDEEPQSRKRKEMEEDFKLDEIESIMSEDMDFEENTTSSHHQEEQKHLFMSAQQSKHSHMFESTNKRQRVHQEVTERSRQSLQTSLETESHINEDKSKPYEKQIRVKTERLSVRNNMSAYQESSDSSAVSARGAIRNNNPFKEDEPSFIEDEDLLQVDISSSEESKESKKLIEVKQEVKETKIDEDLPKQLLLVEFRSLTVMAAEKPKQIRENRNIQNFKCFRKKRVPGADGLPHIIGGSDLLAHSRGKNSELDEWLKEAIEEERQNKRDDAVGDDLFRYNPTKMTKRR